LKLRILAREVKQLVDLLVNTTDENEIATIHGAIRIKLKMIREILDGQRI